MHPEVCAVSWQTVAGWRVRLLTTEEVAEMFDPLGGPNEIVRSTP